MKAADSRLLRCGRGLQSQAGRQKGATLVIGLILLLLVTMMVVSAFTLSTTNLKAVGNMQARQEALAAANEVIELVVGTNFTASPTSLNSTATQYPVDINNDSVTDYTVTVELPICIRAFAAGTGGKSDVELGSAMSALSIWNTEWQINALATNSVNGASVRVLQGVSIIMSDTQKNTVCP